MAISCGSRAHLEKDSVAQVNEFLVLRRLLLGGHFLNTGTLLPTALYVSNIPDVRLSLPGVVLLCERHQGHTMWLQAFHSRSCTQDLFCSSCREMVS